METVIRERDESESIVNPLKVKQDITLYCKHCNEGLMKVVVMERDGVPQLEWDIFAYCFACGSRSKIIKIVGQYAYSGLFDGEKELTSVVDIEMNNDTIGFFIKRKDNHAQEN